MACDSGSPDEAGSMAPPSRGRILDAVDEAIKRAEYTELKDGTFEGTIAGYSLRAFGLSRITCERYLRAGLEAVLSYRLASDAQ